MGGIQHKIPRNMLTIRALSGTKPLLEPGVRFTNGFPSQLNFDRNFVSLLPWFFLYRDRYKILYMARQLCCRGMTSNGIMTRRSFHRIWIVDKKTVSETGPRVVQDLWRQMSSPNHGSILVVGVWYISQKIMYLLKQMFFNHPFE